MIGRNTDASKLIWDQGVQLKMMLREAAEIIGREVTDDEWNYLK